MQTSSKVEFDSWKDINLGDILNIRPVGTYGVDYHHHHHHHHYYPVPVPGPGYMPCPPHHAPCEVEHDHCDPFHDGHDHCHPHPHHCPPKHCPPHHAPCEVEHDHCHPCPCPPKPHGPLPHVLADKDHDGFIDGDIYVDPIMPLHPHHHCEPQHPHIQLDKDHDGFIDGDIYVDTPVIPHPHHDEMHHHFYGTELPETEATESVVEPVETDPVIDDMLGEVTESQDDIWTTPVMEEEPVDVHPEIEEHVELPIETRTRRINRGGRRKKED